MKTRSAALKLLLGFTILSVSVVNGIDVYLHPQLNSPIPAQLDAQHASLAVARHLGLERFERLGEGDGIWAGEFTGNSDGEGVVATAARDGLLLALSEEDAKKILPSNFKPTFSLLSPPLESLYPLLHTYLHRAAHVYTSVFSATNEPAPGRILDIFSAPTTANKAFLTSVSGVVEFLDLLPTNADDYGFENFGAFELNGLKDLAAQYGADSESYQTALKTLQVVIQSALSRTDLKLALLTYPVPSTQYNKRADPPQSPIPSPLTHPAEPISAVSTCFTSEESCANSTSNCSGHGQCVSATKAGKTCYICACSASRDEKGRKDEWAGIACERKDVSGPFVLLGGTVIALIVLVAGSVGLLTGIGSHQLPSVLTGGVAGGLKKD